MTLSFDTASFDTAANFETSDDHLNTVSIAARNARPLAFEKVRARSVVDAQTAMSDQGHAAAEREFALMVDAFAYAVAPEAFIEAGDDFGDTSEEAAPKRPGLFVRFFSKIYQFLSDYDSDQKKLFESRKRSSYVDVGF